MGSDELVLYVILGVCAALLACVACFVCGRVAGYDAAMGERDLERQGDPAAHIAAMTPASPFDWDAVSPRTWEGPRHARPRLAPQHAGETDTGWMRRVTGDFIDHRIPALARGDNDA